MFRIDRSIYKGILDSLYDGVYFTDTERRITYWNKGAERITGFRSDEVMGKHCSDNVLMHVNDGGDHLCEKMCPLAACIQDGRQHEADVYLHHKSGHRVPVLVRVSPLRDTSGEIIGAVEIFSDSTSQLGIRQRVTELEKIAMIDPLTQLGNRRYFEINISSRLDEMRRYGWQFGVLFIDIDNFKRVNDLYGHNVGDRVLKMVADTMSHSLRAFDMLGRWGGEEFIALIVNADKALVSSISRRLLVLVEHSSLAVASEILSVTVSIGATIAMPEDTIESLVKRADDLMYQSKLSGRNRVSM